MVSGVSCSVKLLRHLRPPHSLSSSRQIPSRKCRRVSRCDAGDRLTIFCPDDVGWRTCRGEDVGREACHFRKLSSMAAVERYGRMLSGWIDRFPKALESDVETFQGRTTKTREGRKPLRKEKTTTRRLSGRGKDTGKANRSGMWSRRF